jgi:hypothetical protein
MRGLIFTTGSRDTEKMYQSFTYQYPDTEVVQYDTPSCNMLAVAEARKPDIIIWIGAHRGSHHIPGVRPVPDTQELARVGRVAPMVHMCPDSGDDPWWPEIEDFERNSVFALQVGIDGCKNSPISKFGMVALTPIDPAYFPDVPWDQKVHGCGFAGGGGFRAGMMDDLSRKGLLTRFDGGDYKYMCAFYSLCKLVINDARTGTGARRHVKGRFVEAALAGAVPIEPHDAPTSDWFKPGEEYLVWHDHAEIESNIRSLSTSASERYRDMAAHLRRRMIEEHSPVVFWDKILKRIGLLTLVS